MNVIEVKNLVKHFGKTKAVDGISFEVGEGEIFGYLGQNGAGKTTTISCLMDFLRPNGGNAQILGRDAQKDAVVLKKDIGYLSDTLALYDKWNALKHFALADRLNGQHADVTQLVKRLELDTHTPAGKLSTGNRQKIGIILGLMHKPKLLILDEPTKGLDPIMQNIFYELIQELAAQGSTVFMSSHNLAEVEKVCSRVCIIRAGKIVTTESIESLKEKSLYHITVSFKDVPPAQNLSGPGIEIKSKTKDGYVVDVRGEIQPALKMISAYPIKNIEVKRASLENIFFEYYAK